MRTLATSEFRSICAACDRVLSDAGTSRATAAITWLHVHNEHPVNVAKYLPLFAGSTGDGHALARSVARLVLGSRRRGRSSGDPASGLGRADVIFVSHLLNAAQIGAGEDFYFGAFPECLRERGQSSMVVLWDHAGLPRAGLGGGWPAGMAPRYVLPHARAWADEIALWRVLRAECGRLRAAAKTAGDPFDRLVRDMAARQALSSPSVATLRFYRVFRRIAEATRPKAVVVTYEGHAWERLAFAAARDAVPGVRCFGYQHAVVLPNQHGMRRTLGSPYDPDVVLTSGAVATDLLARDVLPAGAKLATVGTHRSERRERSWPEQGPESRPPACLAIPDGTVEECLTVFDFALAAAALVPHVRFLLRMHPVLPFAAVARRDPRLARLPGNVVVSEGSIQEDFRKCRWAFYRGSGAVIRAVAAGLRPFYVARAGEMSIDPLYAMEGWRVVADSPKGFATVVERDLGSERAALEREAAPAVDYCRRYYSKADPGAFLDALPR